MAGSIPDLTPLDYFLWGYLKSKVYATQPADLVELRGRIVDQCAIIPPDMITRAIGAFYCLAHCQEIKGEQFEHINWDKESETEVRINKKTIFISPHHVHVVDPGNAENGERIRKNFTQNEDHDSRFQSMALLYKSLWGPRIQNMIRKFDSQEERIRKRRFTFAR